MGYDASPRERILPLVWMATFLRAHLHWARSMVSRSGMSDPLGLSIKLRSVHDNPHFSAGVSHQSGKHSESSLGVRPGRVVCTTSCACRHSKGQEDAMPAKKKGSHRKYGEAAGKAVENAMHREKRGILKSGKGGRGGKVKSRKQAIAIGLSEARKKGAKVPRKRAA